MTTPWMLYRSRSVIESNSTLWRMSVKMIAVMLPTLTLRMRKKTETWRMKTETWRMKNRVKGL